MGEEKKDRAAEQAHELDKAYDEGAAVARAGVSEGEDMGPSGTQEDGPLREEDVRESDGLDDREPEEGLPGDRG